MWSVTQMMWRGDPTNGGQNSLDTGFLNNLILKHPIKLPLIGVAIGVGCLAVAYFRRIWGPAVPGVFLLLICVPLLVVGVIRGAIELVRERRKKDREY